MELMAYVYCSIVYTRFPRILIIECDQTFCKEFCSLIILIVHSVRKLHRNLNHQQNQFRWSRMELLLFLVRSKEIVEYELLTFERLLPILLFIHIRHLLNRPMRNSRMNPIVKLFFRI